MADQKRKSEQEKLADLAQKNRTVAGAKICFGEES